MENSKKIGFFRKVIMAIKDFDEYKDFAIEDLKTIIKYVLKLMLLFAIILSIGFIIKLNGWINTGTSYIKNDIGDFNIVSGNLQMESSEPIVIENENSPLNIIIIDTNKENDENNINKLDTYNTGLLILENKIYLRTSVSGISSTDVWYSYSDLKINNATKAELLDEVMNKGRVYISAIVFVFVVMVTFITYTAQCIIYIGLLTVLGYIASRLFGIPLKFGAVLNIAVYSMTLPVVLGTIYLTVRLLTGFEIQYFDLMYNAISYVYMLTAILLIKSDLIKRNIELTAIIEEQEKVKAELERQRQEEELEKHRKEKEKEKEEKGDSNSEEKPKKEKGEAPERVKGINIYKKGKRHGQKR